MRTKWDDPGTKWDEQGIQWDESNTSLVVPRTKWYEN